MLVEILTKIMFDFKQRMASPTDVVKRFGSGCNAGGLFEMQNHDTGANTVSPILKAMSDKGFKHVRIPVTWYPENLNGTCRLDDPIFMKNLDNAVYYANYLGLGIILNCHFEAWFYDHYDGSQALKDKFWLLWQRIAKRYDNIKQIDLIFETLNELQGNLGDWNRNNCNDPTALP